MQNNQTLYYDASCGLCRREIEHLRPRLERAGVKLKDISASEFEPPSGYTQKVMLERIHFHNGEVMLTGFPATLAYWRLSGSILSTVAGLLRLPGFFHVTNMAYERWAAWRIGKQHC